MLSLQGNDGICYNLHPPGQHAILMFAIFYHVIRTLRIKSLRTLRRWLHLFNPKELFFVVYRPERNNDEWRDVYCCNNMTIHLCTAMLFLLLAIWDRNYTAFLRSRASISIKTIANVYHPSVWAKLQFTW